MLDNYLLNRYSHNDILKLKEKYQSNHPFPHIVFENFFKNDLINSVSSSFPDLKKINSYEKNDLNEKKFGYMDINKFPEIIKNFILFLNSPEFLAFLNKITDVKEPLIADPFYYGGGLHQTIRGGFLKIHSDFYLHPKTKLDRRLNILIYLNKNWKEEYGGALELWDKDMKKCEKKIFPHINNICIFSTDHRSFHGSPDVLACPENVARNSIALYYYSNGRSDTKEVYRNKNTTNWKKRFKTDIIYNNYGVKDYLRRFSWFRKIKKLLVK